MRSPATNPPTVTVHVPMTFAIRGGRKQIISECSGVIDSESVLKARAPRRTGNALLKALARAHRWQRMIENSEYTSITELARAENINESYACRVLRLTLLAPDIITDLLNQNCASNLMLKGVLKKLPGRWDAQRTLLGVTDHFSG